VPIIAFSPNAVTRRRLALLWGVTSFYDRGDARPRRDDRAREHVPRGERARVARGDKFVAMFGAPVGVTGSTNSIRVRVVE
jgi:pyruvate kinase